MGDDADDNSDDESVEDGEIVEAASSRWEPPQRGILFHGRFFIVLYYDLVNLYTLISHYIFPPF